MNAFTRALDGTTSPSTTQTYLSHLTSLGKAILRVDGGVLIDLQKCHSGAIGACAIHSLFYYQKSDPLFEDTTKRFSATYHCGLLQPFGIVVRPSQMPDKLFRTSHDSDWSSCYDQRS